VDIDRILLIKTYPISGEHMKFISMIKSNWLSGLVTIFLASFLIVTHLRLNQYAFDDAFIHFRVARNLIENGHPFYNINEMVKVSTSSGWTVFLAILFGIARLFKIDNNYPMIVGITNAAISLCGMLVYTKVVEILLSRRLSLIEKILFQIPNLALLLPSSIGLMETPFALLVAGLGILLLVKSKPSGFALLGFAAYIRLELLVLVGLAVVLLLLQKQFRPWKIALYLALGVGPFLAYDLYFFHTIIPNAIVAKSIVFSIPGWVSAFYILVHSLPALPFHQALVSFCVGMAFLVIVLVTAFSVLVIGRPRRLTDTWPALFCLWSLFIMGGYILTHALEFPWYLPLYTIPLLVACFTGSLSDQAKRNMIFKSMIPVVFLVSVLSLASTYWGSTMNPDAFSWFGTNARVKVYLKTGAILNEEYPGARLLTSEIGGLGYTFKGEILDAAGLASPEALKYQPLTIPDQRATGDIGGIPPGYVRENMPEIIVTYDVFAKALLSDDVVRQYNVILIPALLPEDAIYSESKTIWGSKYLYVYIRKDLPISKKISALGK